MSGYDRETGLTFGQAKPDNLIVEFKLEAKENGFLSAQQGSPVYEDVEMVTIIVPGDKHTEIVEAVNDTHRQRWAQQYALFKQGLEQAETGTPVAQWPPLTPALVKMLQSVNVRTVEQLAGLSDAALPSIGLGGRKLRDQAIAWLKNAADGRPLAEALAAKEQLENRLAAQSAEMAELKAIVERLQANMPAPVMAPQRVDDFQ